MRATSFEISPEVLFWAVVAGVVPTEPKSDISRCDDSALFFFRVGFSSAQEQRARQTKGKKGGIRNTNGEEMKQKKEKKKRSSQ